MGEEEIIDVVRRVLATLTSKTEVSYDFLTVQTHPNDLRINSYSEVEMRSIKEGLVAISMNIYQQHALANLQKSFEALDFVV